METHVINGSILFKCRQLKSPHADPGCEESLVCALLPVIRLSRQPGPPAEATISQVRGGLLPRGRGSLSSMLRRDDLAVRLSCKPHMLPPSWWLQGLCRLPPKPRPLCSCISSPLRPHSQPHTPSQGHNLGFAISGYTSSFEIPNSKTTLSDWPMALWPSYFLTFPLSLSWAVPTSQRLLPVTSHPSLSLDSSVITWTISHWHLNPSASVTPAWPSALSQSDRLSAPPPGSEHSCSKGHNWADGLQSTVKTAHCGCTLGASLEFFCWSWTNCRSSSFFSYSKPPLSISACSSTHRW